MRERVAKHLLASSQPEKCRLEDPKAMEQLPVREDLSRALHWILEAWQHTSERLLCHCEDGLVARAELLVPAACTWELC